MRLLIADDNESVLEQLQTYLKPRVSNSLLLEMG